MSSSGWHRPLGALADGENAVVLTPAVAGWERVGLRVLLLHPGESVVLRMGEFEGFVLPLSGGCVVDVDGERFGLVGRESVFTRVSDFAYVPRDSSVRVSTEGGVEVAVPMARCERRLPPRHGAAEDVPVEVRGSGNATRQVTNFGVPGAWDHADRLMACELVTPGGNWSSYPPHKHDLTCDVVNEEVYYFRIAGRDQVTPSREGFGFHRTYTDDGEVDDAVLVRDGDVFLVPRGHHGPCVAAPGYPMYYLNVLAGPNPRRSMAFCDDPAHTWVRGTWARQDQDPRCPVTSAAGRVATGGPR
ncbi:5-deoxy-glucuronate isomerase [Saccharothrix syringae]|uniref:5-deoxy-glucuronate isomerase n=1 Tax=Saccharothrix syringae TaxID=103733 RepID=A0A5Q0HBX3_SACSY|nr:5-deoxy-glucuronate isomerase [Saccharothrix syringae]QFZ23691.1 5-deoxy-glucuronate isomerase [Saccharothrix syringae]